MSEERYTSVKTLQSVAASLTTTVVSFTNILGAAFSTISFRQKMKTQTVSTKKAVRKLLYKKMLLKC